MKRFVTSSVFVVLMLIAATAAADWFDIPVTPNVSFTAADDATWTVTTANEYSARYLNAETIVLSVNVEGEITGGAPFEIYVALPSGKSAPRPQRFAVYSDVGSVYGTSEGSVVTIRRSDGGQFSGSLKIGFTQTFRINAAPPPPCTTCDPL